MARMQKNPVYFVATCLTFFFAVAISGASFPRVAHASTANSDTNASLPDGFESYLARPSISDVKSKRHELGREWTNLRDAHYVFVAELFELYPADTHFYFLARDSELLFDVARLATHGTDAAKRIHLLNVSRANMRDPQLRNYLSQNDLSTSSLQEGQRVVLVDTGFAGTISRVICELFPENLRRQILTHLIVSQHPRHPSSRAFLSVIDKNANRIDASDLHHSIVEYEHLPRFTHRSTAFMPAEDAIHPLSPELSAEDDGKISKLASLQYMEDLRASWELPATKSFFARTRVLFRGVLQRLEGGTIADRDSIRRALRASTQTSRRDFTEGFIRDALEASPNLRRKFRLDLGELGLSEVAISEEKRELFELLKFHPEWSAVIQHPETEIDHLFKSEKWDIIESLLRSDLPFDYKSLVIDFLFSEVATGRRKQIQIDLIKTSDQNMLSTISERMGHLHQTEIEQAQLLFEKLSMAGRVFYARSITNQLILRPWSEPFINTMIEFSSPPVRTRLLETFLKRVNHGRLPQLYSKLMSALTEEELVDLARWGISASDSERRVELSKYIIEHVTSEKMSKILTIFSHPETAPNVDLWRLFLSKADASGIEKLKLLPDFSSSKWLVKTDPVFQRAIYVDDPFERDRYIETHLSQVQVGKTTAEVLRGLSQSPTKPIKPNELYANDAVLIRNRRYTIVREVGMGRRGVVYQVRGENGALYALKVARSNDVETLESIRKESEKARAWQKLGIPHAKVLVQEKEFVLKTWIEGIGGKDLVERSLKGDPTHAQAMESLFAIVNKVRRQGAYIGDFRPANLVWAGKSWVIVDSGGVEQGMTVAEAQARWSQADGGDQKFRKRWQVALPALTCDSIFR